MSSSSNSLNKKQVLSGLIEARKAIKSKFKKAYEERASLERGVKQVMKPVLTTFGEFQKKNLEKSSENTLKNQSRNVKFASEKFPRKSLKKKRVMSDNEANYSRRGQKLDYETDYYTSDSGMRFSTPFTTMKKQTGKENPEDFSYQVKSDNDDRQNYGIFPPANVRVFGTKTNKFSGEVSPLNIKFKHLPLKVQKQWSSERKKQKDKSNRSTASDANRMLDYSSGDDGNISDTDTLRNSDSNDDHGNSSSSAHDEEIQDDVIPKSTVAGGKGTRKAALATIEKLSTSKIKGKKAGGGMKKPLKSKFDFNFVPFQNRKVVYTYFDDVNELCSRLQLLIASRSAGNSNISHIHEISSIIEELRELGHIE